MNFLRRLLGGTPAGDDRNGLYLYVRCNNCGTPVQVRVDLANALSATEYDDAAANGYEMTKEIQDDRCFRIMRATLTFDSNRRETGRQIQGGTFITAEEYETLHAERAKPTPPAAG